MLIMKLREYWNARESDMRGNAEDEGVRRKERGWPGKIRTEKGYERKSYDDGNCDARGLQRGKYKKSREEYKGPQRRLEPPQRRQQELPRGIHVSYLRKQGPEMLDGCTRLHWAGTTMSTWRGGDDNLEPQVQGC